MLCVQHDTRCFGDMPCLVSVELNWPQTTVAMRLDEGFLPEVLRDFTLSEQPYPTPQLPRSHKADNSKRQCQDPPSPSHSWGPVSGFKRLSLSKNCSNNKSYTKKLLGGEGMYNAFFYFEWQSVMSLKRLELSRIALYLRVQAWGKAFWVQNLPLAPVSWFRCVF